MDDTRPFPIQGEWSNKEWSRLSNCTIPWWLAEIAYRQYSKLFGSDQSLKQIAERGGFGRQELLNLLREKDAKTTD